MIVWTGCHLVVGLFSHGALGNAVHREECLEERDDGRFKFWKFLFICGGLFGFFLFVCFGLL